MTPMMKVFFVIIFLYLELAKLITIFVPPRVGWVNIIVICAQVLLQTHNNISYWDISPLINHTL